LIERPIRSPMTISCRAGAFGLGKAVKMSWEILVFCLGPAGSRPRTRSCQRPVAAPFTLACTRAIFCWQAQRRTCNPPADRWIPVSLAPPGPLDPTLSALFPTRNEARQRRAFARKPWDYDHGWRARYPLSASMFLYAVQGGGAELGASGCSPTCGRPSGTWMNYRRRPSWSSFMRCRKAPGTI
jgi:hypothetical protein